MGNCLAGDKCPFSHDPSALVSNLSVDDSQHASPPMAQPYMDNTTEAFPPLQSPAPAGDQWDGQYSTYPTALQGIHPGGSGNESMNHFPHHQPTSQPQNRGLNPTAPSVDDPDAFPTLAAVGSKNTGKKQGKRGATASSKDSTPSSLADVVRLTPSPAAKGKPMSKNQERTSREASAAAQAIPAPQHIPWLETGSRANQQYLKYRAEAIQHGTVRNKFLQR